MAVVDTAICVLFLINFANRLVKTENKLRFLKWGWIDFVSSIPMIDFLRWGRLVRVTRVLRVLRGIRSVKYILRFVFESRIKGALASALLAAIFLLVFSRISILHLEREPGSNIRTPSDALWWSISELTTASFSDKFPITPEGRMLVVLLVLAGMGLFAVFTACFASASWFLAIEEWVEQVSIGNLQEQITKLACVAVCVRSQRQTEEQTIQHPSPQIPSWFSPRSAERGHHSESNLRIAANSLDVRVN